VPGGDERKMPGGDERKRPGGDNKLQITNRPLIVIARLSLPLTVITRFRFCG